MRVWFDHRVILDLTGQRVQNKLDGNDLLIVDMHTKEVLHRFLEGTWHGSGQEDIACASAESDPNCPNCANPPPVLAPGERMRMAISPGQNPDGQTFNLEICIALQTALERCGQDVWSAPSMSLGERLWHANRDGTRLFIVCAHHSDDAGSTFLFCPGQHRWETPFWSDRTPNRQNALAEHVGKQLIAYGITSKWTVQSGEVDECRSFNFDTLYCNYLSMTADGASYQQPDYAVRAAEATCQGIAQVLGFTYVYPYQLGANDASFSS